MNSDTTIIQRLSSYLATPRMLDWSDRLPIFLSFEPFRARGDILGLLCNDPIMIDGEESLA